MRRRSTIRPAHPSSLLPAFTFSSRGGISFRVENHVKPRLLKGIQEAVSWRTPRPCLPPESCLGGTQWTRQGLNLRRVWHWGWAQLRGGAQL